MWQQKGGELNGDRSNNTDTAGILSADYDDCRYDPSWLVIQVAPSSNPNVDPFFLGAKVLPMVLVANDEQFSLAVLNAVLENNKIRRVLFVTESGQKYNEILAKIAKLPLPATFVLTGGMEAYCQHLQLQIASLGRRQVTLAGSMSKGSRSGMSYGHVSGCGCKK